ncbi:MAG TPA: DUF4440 domain-containing protein [Pseudomonadaceae bacterium]|nr:DUF4440 domain-containing protein [Pseudomonadaceae bacterium]
MSAALESGMRALEERLLHDDFRASAERLDALLAEDLVEIDGSGRQSDRAAIRHWLLNKDPAARWCLSELQVRELSAELRLVLYHARQVEPPRPHSAGSRRSSLWRFDAGSGSWQLCFHQASKLK